MLLFFIWQGSRLTEGKEAVPLQRLGSEIVRASEREFGNPMRKQWETKEGCRNPQCLCTPDKESDFML
jgi:hypothetical protein